MQYDHNLSLVATASGVAGEVTRAISEQITLSTISLHRVVDVAFYAVVSASEGYGYGVKVTWDFLFRR